MDICARKCHHKIQFYLNFQLKQRMKLTTVKQSQSHCTQPRLHSVLQLQVHTDQLCPLQCNSLLTVTEIHFLYVFVPDWIGLDVDQLFHYLIGNIFFLSLCDWPTEKLLFSVAKLTKQQR